MNVSVYAQYTVRACVLSMNISMCVQYKRLTVCSVRASQCILSTKYERFSVCSVQTSQCVFSINVSLCVQYERLSVFSVQSTNVSVWVQYKCLGVGSVCVEHKRIGVCSVQISQCVFSTDVSVCVQYKCHSVCVQYKRLSVFQYEWLNVFSVQTYLLMLYSPLSSKLRLLLKKTRSLRLVLGTAAKSLTSGKRSDDSPTFFFVVGCCKLLQLEKHLALCISL